MIARPNPAEAHRRAALVHARAAEAQFAVLSAEIAGCARPQGAGTAHRGGRFEGWRHRRAAVAGATGHLARLSRDWEYLRGL